MIGKKKNFFTKFFQLNHQSVPNVVVSTLLHSFLKHVGGGAVGVGGVESASTNSQTSSVSISVTFTQTGVSITSSTISHLKKD